jgi:hypothetical protein
MRWTIIVASSDAAQLELLMEAAETISEKSATSPRARIFNAMSVDEVMRWRKGTRDSATELLIVTAGLLGDRSDADLAGQPGFDLVKTLQNESNPPACILVSERIEHYREVQKMGRCEWLLVDAATNYVDLCVKLAAKLGVFSAQSQLTLPDLNASPKLTANGRRTPGYSPATVTVCDGVGPPPGSPITAFSSSSYYALLEVDLPTRARSATVRLQGVSPVQQFTFAAAPLNLRQSDVDDIVKYSRSLRTQFSRALADSDERQKFHRHWHTKYKSLGEQIFKLLWSGKFVEYYNFAKGAVGAPNLRVRFNLERAVFDGLWEAMYDPNDTGFLMLQSPVARRAHQQVDNFENDIDGGDGVLNVLFISSDVPDSSVPEGPDDPAWNDFWISFNGRLPHLAHLNDEIKLLRKLQRDSERSDRNQNGPTRRKIQVDILRGDLRPGRSNSLAEVVERRLKKDPQRYDVVHFAGHALFPSKYDQKQDGRGYLVFSGSPPRAVPVAMVADWLKNTSVQLVCLSCCRSSAVQAAKEFADNNVPMTIGFSWDLDDRKAVDFTRFFYQELLTEARLKVCRAFCNARSKLHKQYEGGDPIWASPVLIAQPMNWIKVEGALCPPMRKLAARARRRRTVPVGRSDVGAGIIDSRHPLAGEATLRIGQTSTA